MPKQKPKGGPSGKGYGIELEPVGRRGQCTGRESLLACARQLGVGINSICGGQGTCHACKVQALSGTVSKPTTSELDTFSSQELKEGWRLACQSYPVGDAKLRVPPESITAPQRTQVEGLEITVPAEPYVRAYHLRLSAPSLPDTQADADRLLKALDQQYQLHCDQIDIGVLRTLPTQLRAWKWECQASVRNNELVALSPWPGHQLGLAVDLGTTKIAGYLLNLADGHTLIAKGVMNPQISYGEDIISRINRAIKSPTEHARLHKLVKEALKELTVDLCAEVNASPEEIVEAVVVGNTAMHHFFLGLPLKQLALAPFIPTVSRSLDVKARDLGLEIATGAFIYAPPNVAGFVGADHVAMLLATEIWKAEGPAIALDIGTNTEVSLADNGEITSISCASGPAFECGHIKDGMRAATGAIEKVRIDGDKIQYQTIDNAPPVGICGSGILDAVAQLYLADVIDTGGRMNDHHPRVRTRKGQREFVLVDGGESRREIVITQHDIREIQLAKAAIRAGINTLLEVKGGSEEEIKQVIIAGAFGSYIDVSSAITIGMLPALPLNRYRQVGNAAGIGAKLMLISASQRAQAEALASRVNYLELASAPNLNQTFIQANYLGRYRITHGKRETID